MTPQTSLTPTSADDSAGNGNADATTAEGSLLGRVVTWTSDNDPLSCTVDTSVTPAQVSCASTYDLMFSKQDIFLNYCPRVARHD